MTNERGTTTPAGKGPAAGQAARRPPGWSSCGLHHRAGSRGRPGHGSGGGHNLRRGDHRRRASGAGRGRLWRIRRARPDIQIRYHGAVRALDGSGRAGPAQRRRYRDQDARDCAGAALIVLIAEPHTEWPAGSVLLDDGGLRHHRAGTRPRHPPPIARDRAITTTPYLMETSLPGVFAACDLRSGSAKGATAAVGEGSIAIRFVSEPLGRRAGFAPPARQPG